MMRCKLQMHWRFERKHNQWHLMSNYPMDVGRMWFGLPADFKRIDTVYENRAGKMIFFIGECLLPSLHKRI